MPNAASEKLREIVRQRLLQDSGDRMRQLHRPIDLGFPEFTRYVRGLDSELACAILHDQPTAATFHGVAVKRLAASRYDGRRQVGVELTRALIEAARHSVSHHHIAACRVQIRYACQDLDTLRRRLRELDHQIEAKLNEHEVGRLLTTSDGIGPHTAAFVIGEIGDPARFRAASALAACVGAIPGLKQSGKRNTTRAALTPIANARWRAALWMPSFTAVRCNPSFSVSNSLSRMEYHRFAPPNSLRHG